MIDWSAMSAVKSRNEFSGAIVPAPWTLTGSGLILIYASRDTESALPNFLENSKQLPVKILMLVNYNDSGVGPYREVLYMPGAFFWKKKLCGHISKILVDTESSVSSGIFNWGIPKELAKIKSSEDSSKISYEAVMPNKSSLFAIIEKGEAEFPVSNSFFPLSILQESDGIVLETKITAKGRARLAKLSHLETSLQGLPQSIADNPRLVLEIPEFEMVFPVPEIHGYSG